MRSPVLSSFWYPPPGLAPTETATSTEPMVPATRPSTLRSCHMGAIPTPLLQEALGRGVALNMAASRIASFCPASVLAAHQASRSSASVLTPQFSTFQASTHSFSRCRNRAERSQLHSSSLRRPIKARCRHACLRRRVRRPSGRRFREVRCVDIVDANRLRVFDIARPG